MTTLPNSHPDVATLVCLTTPCVALCPHSGEPQAGSTITVRYRPGAALIELHAVQTWLMEQAGGSEALDLETLAQRCARWAAACAGVPVTVIARYRLRGDLEMTVCCRS
ncbi:MAG TPA: hypothetical protein VFT99_13900 [Roseiflexaceae bacterium]|nr:hypothetical protein [Roseiflexaceae bacterium]